MLGEKPLDTWIPNELHIARFGAPISLVTFTTNSPAAWASLMSSDMMLWYTVPSVLLPEEQPSLN